MRKREVQPAPRMRTSTWSEGLDIMTTLLAGFWGAGGGGWGEGGLVFGGSLISVSGGSVILSDGSELGVLVPAESPILFDDSGLVEM